MNAPIDLFRGSIRATKRLAIVLVAAAAVMCAVSARAQGPSWNVTGCYTGYFEVQDGYNPFSMCITSEDCQTGNFTGTFDGGPDTLSGNTSGNYLSFSLYNSAWIYQGNGFQGAISPLGVLVPPPANGPTQQYGPGGQWNGWWSTFTGAAILYEPPVPTNLTATPGDTQAILNWTAEVCAPSFNVYRGTASNEENPTPYQAGLTTPAFTDTGLTNETTYYYMVATVNANGTSTASNEVSVTPSALPTVAAAASATPNPVAGNSAALSILGGYSDAGGESALTYTWAATGPAAVTYTDNGDNSAKDTTATFSAAGTYDFTVMIANPYGRSTMSSVTVTVKQTLTSVAVTPGPTLALTLVASQQFTATGFDQFGHAMASQPAFNWSITSGVGSIGSSTGLYHTGSTPGTATIKARTGTFAGTCVVTVNPASLTVATAASATPNPVAGSSTNLSVLGAYSGVGGQSALTYTWSATGPAVVLYGVNGTNSARNTSAIFVQAGTYQITASISDGIDPTVASSVSVTVNQTLTSIVVSPTPVTPDAGGGTTFTAVAYDQFGAELASQPAFTWSLSAGSEGSINAVTGVYSAGAAAGAATVRAVVGAVGGYASVTVLSPAVTIVNAASATPNPISGTSASLSVLGAYGGTGGAGALTYTWSSTGPHSVSYSANGTNAAQNATATFSAAGSYVITATVASPYGQSATSSVTVHVGQTPTSIAVTPSSVALDLGGGDTFTAIEYDQFGIAMGTQPIFAWSVGSGSVGSIGSSTGIYAAGAVSGSSSVLAADGSVTGAASVTVNLAPVTVTAPASANPNPVTGVSAGLTVLGAYTGPGGAGALTYTWSSTGPAPVTYSANGTNAARITTAAFGTVGSYALTATIASPYSSTTSSVSVLVNQTLTSIVVTPGPTLTLGPPLPQSQQFAAIALDQFGNALATQPSFNWSLASGSVGSIGSSSGLYHSGSVAGSATVKAKSGAVAETSTVTVN